jgi:hypothetical protein
VILYRCFAWDERSRGAEVDGPLWFPRAYQGEGRHDNPDLYGCLYLADRGLSSVIEQLARFRSQRLTPPLLRRRGLPLALAEIELPDGVEIVNLDDPSVLRRENLRPSIVATRQRHVTQPQARKLYEGNTRIVGLSWWSTYESLWTNMTLFDRSAPRLRLQSVRVLEIGDPAVIEAAHFFELRMR